MIGSPPSCSGLVRGFVSVLPQAVRNLLVHVLGWRGAVLHGDLFLFDRWRWLRRRLQPGRVRTLDAGSGSGAFSVFAAAIGNQVVGLSFDEANNSVARDRARIVAVGQRVEFRQADLRLLDELSHSLGSFDQIVCQETIEHITDDEKLVRDLAGLLKPGGRLLLTTPNRAHRPMFDERVSEVEDGGHVRYGYTHEDLHALFAQADLEMIETDLVGGLLSQRFTWLMGWLHLRLGLPLAAAWAVTFPLRLLTVIDRPLTSALSYPYVSVAAVAMPRPAM